MLCCVVLCCDRDEYGEYSRQLAVLSEIATKERKAIQSIQSTVAGALTVASAGASAGAGAGAGADASGASGGAGAEVADSAASGGGGSGGSGVGAVAVGQGQARSRSAAEKQLAAAVELRTTAYIRRKQRQMLFDGRTDARTPSASAAPTTHATQNGEVELGSEAPASSDALPSPSAFRLHHHTANPQEDLFTDPTPPTNSSNSKRYGSPARSLGSRRAVLC
jgi:hypothetical protein